MSSSAAPWPLRLRGHLSLARISNSPTVVTNALAGAALVGGTGGQALPAAIGMTLFYTAGMYLNDLLDVQIDRRERPERPLPSGLIAPGEAWAVTALLFAAGFALLLLAGGRAPLGGVVLAALIVLYDVWHKTNPLSPVVMGATRALVYLTAALAVTPVPGVAVTVWALLLAAYTAGLTYVAKTEGRPQPPHSQRPQHWAARYWPVALVAAPVIYALLGGFAWPVWLAALVLAAWTVHSLGFVYGPRRNIGASVGKMIAGMCLLDAAVLAAAGAWAWLPLAYAAFLLTLWWQQHIKGT
ncbi:4-hydroxybenzoate polyprenyltransferase [Deinococcus saxicola]|uniref:UbiA family prenyltransferase n=1 Tax=Deinococcus saxicola TaxID=249406 RepID=UPI0039EF81DA